MTLEEIQQELKKTYRLTDSRILSGKISNSEIASLIKNVIENKEGRFFFPSATYHNISTCISKARNQVTVGKIVRYAQEKNLIIYKFRQFIDEKPKDSVYSARTIKKAKTAEKKLFQALCFSDCWRVCKLEKAGGRNGSLHVQGICLLPKGDYDKETFQVLDYFEISKGVKEFLSYLKKPADQKLERSNKKKVVPFTLALLGLAEWYVGSRRNRLNGKKQNPRTSWIVNIPRAKRNTAMVSMCQLTFQQPFKSLSEKKNPYLRKPRIHPKGIYKITHEEAFLLN